MDLWLVESIGSENNDIMVTGEVGYIGRRRHINGLSAPDAMALHKFTYYLFCVLIKLILLL